MNQSVLLHISPSSNQRTYFPLSPVSGSVTINDRIIGYKFVEKPKRKRGRSGGNGAEGTEGIELSWTDASKFNEKAEEELKYQNKTMIQLREALERSKAEQHEKRELVQSWSIDPSIQPSEEENRSLLNEIGMLVVEEVRISYEIKAREQQTKATIKGVNRE